MTCFGRICFKAEIQPAISSSVILLTDFPFTSPFKNMVCIIKFPLKRHNCFNKDSKLNAGELGTSICRIRLSNTESSFNMLSSILFKA